MPRKKISTGSSTSGRKITKAPRDRIALAITGIFGNLTFLFSFLFLLTGWILWNLSIIKGIKPIDPYPFPALDFFLSAFAIFLSIAVLISQKRQARLEKIAEEVEFEVNLRAEKEITKVLRMLRSIHDKLGIEQNDPELKKMMEDLDTKKIHQKHKRLQEDD